jgi:hypothetical protein
MGEAGHEFIARTGDPAKATPDGLGADVSASVIDRITWPYRAVAGFYGVSLGAYTVSLLAGLEEGVDAVVAGIPVTDFPGLFHHHSPHDIRARSIEHKIMGGPAENVYRVVSPMSFEAKVPRAGRFIFAGHGDRVATPEQAQRLWEHWDRPALSWYPGGHIGYLWSKQVTAFLVASLAGVPATGSPETGRG